MAIFYDYIKGCNSNKSGISEGAPVLTKIIFQQKNIPTIEVGGVDFGGIITTGIKGQTQTINSITSFPQGIKIGSGENEGFIQIGQVDNGFNFNKGVHIQGDLTAGSCTMGDTSVNKLIVKNNITCNGHIDCTSYIQASYFNATSDRRAKTNIQLSNFKALDIVNQIPVYNFNYISTGSPSIGIMAQDIMNWNIRDFNLVNNLEASGKDGDFMNIKESKLIYILWKAIQELSKEIKDLKNN